MKYGDSLQFFINIEEEGGETLPPLLEEPDVSIYLMEYWGAFRTLSHSRSSGFGVGPIFYSEIVCYLDENKIFDSNEREKYINIIQRLDTVFINLANSSKKPKDDKAKKK